MTALWISAGELSGDMHGALLLRALQELRPDLHYLGMGGSQLRAAGLEALFRTEDLSVMGFTEVLGHLPRILTMLRNIKQTMARVRPQAVVVIDAPDFHFRVIAAARSLNIPVYYYISPKIWAWRQGRAHFIRNHVRKLISILPFEVDFYKKFGMDIDYVGNPLVDLVDYPSLAHIQPEPGTIGLLPGSRKREITSLLPEFGGAARIILQHLPKTRFRCVRAPNMTESFLRAHWPEDVPVEFIPPDNRWVFMRQCEMIIAASGTATLETAITGTPTLVTYKMSPISFALGKLLVKVPYASLTNLILRREIFPELLQNACNAAPLARAALAWLQPDAPLALSGNTSTHCHSNNAIAHDITADYHNNSMRNDQKKPASPLIRIREELAEIRQHLGEPGAPRRAAQIILDDLSTT